MRELSSIVLLAVLLSGLTGCTSATTELRLLSYNIHHGEGTDGQFDYERLAGVIRGADPDAVALQEVDRATQRASGVDQAQRLGELTGMHHVFGEAMPYQGGGYGEAMLTRSPPTSSENHALSCAPGQEPRAAIAVAVDGITVVGTHLCHQSSATRERQCREINDALLEVDTPIVLMGDFNFTPDTDAYALMMAAGWTDAAARFGDARPTFPSHDPVRRIDYVFFRPADAFDVVSVEVLDEPIASDHAPLFVELRPTKHERPGPS